MEEVTLTFILNGISMNIQAKRSEYMKDIFKKYSIKMEKNIENLFFLYNGIKLNEEFRLNQINNSDKDIKILVGENLNNKTENTNENFPKNIVCPKCGENCSIYISDYKINFSKCKNGHNIKNILIDELPSKLKINDTKIYCGKCNIDKDEVYNKEFYKCLECKVNLCPLCNSKHNKKHNIIKYDLLNYTCIEHVEKYLFYCKDCDKNLCGLCGLDHDRNHNIINFKELLDENIDENFNRLRIKIDILKIQINNINNRLNKIINNLELFYKLNELILKNYENKNKNYQIFQNIDEINNFNIKIIDNINKVVDEEKIDIKLNYLNDIYEKMTNKNYIVLNKKNSNKDIEDIKINTKNSIEIIQNDIKKKRK